MSDDDLLKLLIGVTSAFCGWLLAQFTSVVKGWLQGRKIKALLIAELRDLDVEVNRILHFYTRELQIVGADGIGNSSTAGLSNYIFKNYYKDALLSLNQKQRISFQMIHAFVEKVNAGIAELRELTSQIHKEHLANGPSDAMVKTGKAWAAKVKAEFQHSAYLRWYIRFHLKYKKGPDLGLRTQHHEDFLRYMENVRAEMDRVIESGKSIDREKFDQIYDPQDFGH